MAKTQYNATGKPMDLTKLITMISPDDTPLTTLIGETDPATQVLHSWEEDELAAPKQNAHKEGFKYETEEAPETGLKDNVCQIFWRGYGVTKTNQAIKRYNIKDKMARDMQKAMKEIALDVEQAIITSTKKVTGSKNDPRKMAGVPFYVKTNVLANGGAARDLTYKLLNDAIEQVFNCGGNPDVVVVSGRNKRVLSGLLPLNTDRTQKAESKKMVHTIDVFEGDFGRQRVVTNRWMPNDKAFVLSSEYFGLAYLRRFKTEELPNAEDAVRKGIVGELTLEARAEKASAVISDLNGKLAA